MEGIVHKSMEVNGIKMHVAEKGEGPMVLFLHGFPELWYSWRHQIVALSSLGYRAMAPNLRGFGDTEAPSSASSYTCFHMVGDMVALIETLGVDYGSSVPSGPRLGCARESSEKDEVARAERWPGIHERTLEESKEEEERSTGESEVFDAKA